MKYKKIIFAIFAMLIAFSNSVEAKGKPMLSLLQTRIVLENGKSSAVVQVLNKGTAKGVYRIETFDMEMDKDGHLLVVDVEDSIKDLLVFSPKRIEIEPKEVQTVRFMFKNKNQLDNGEYRTHIRFALLPENKTSSYEKNKSDKVSLRLEPVMSFSIPIILREGRGLESKASIKKIKLFKDKIEFNIDRKGEISTYGDIYIKSINKNPEKGEEEEVVISSMKGIAIYTNLSTRKFSIPVDLKSIRGDIVIEYIDKKENIISQRVIDR